MLDKELELAINKETTTHNNRITPPADPDFKNSLRGFKLIELDI